MSEQATGPPQPTLLPSRSDGLLQRTVAELSLELDDYFESMKLHSDSPIVLELDALIGHSPDRTCAERAPQSRS